MGIEFQTSRNSSGLEARKYCELQVTTAYFEDETHISVIPATIGRGLRAVYEGFPAASTPHQAPT